MTPLSEIAEMQDENDNETLPRRLGRDAALQFRQALLLGLHCSRTVSKDNI
jgi:hypothetical protein